MSDDPNGIKINTNLVGRYNLENVVAAATFAHFLDISISIIKQAVENYFPEENRSQLIKANSNNIYLDAYNANPTSMRAALDNFIELKVKNKYFILGEMLEVGDTAEKEHQSLLKFLKEKKILNILCVGKGFHKHADKYGYKYFSNVDELVESGLDRIYIAMDGATQKTQTQYRIGSDIEVIKDNIRKLVEARKNSQGKFPREIIIQNVIDNSTDNIYLKDKQGKFLFINKSQAYWLGLKSPSEAIGKTDFDFFSIEHAERAKKDE